MRRSAALLVYRHGPGGLQVFLVHPGGPFWAKKDFGAWSIPKGEFDEGEDGLVAAEREFFEEVGQRIDGGTVITLTPVKQKGGKVVHTWAVEGEVDETAITSNEFEMEWPPKSGRKARFPEVDRGQWFSVAEARRRVLSGQVPILDELAKRLGAATD
jgi:predicted NUDIX family NTP pyrophosphohydrolase